LAQKKERASFMDGGFGRYFLPAILLQSVLIGGGYATGREIVQYGAGFGALGWITGIMIFIGFSVMAILTFEMARKFQVFDYRSLLKQLIGPFWFLFDIVYLLLAVLIISIVASATGEILNQTMGIPNWIGIVIMMVLVGWLNFYGDRLIEKFKTIGTISLMVGYVFFSILVISSTWENAAEVLRTGDTSFIPGEISIWMVLWTGVIYVGYNLAVYPAALFTIKRQKSVKETIVSGLIAGFLMTSPWFLTYFALLGFYPDEAVLGSSVPWLVMLDGYGLWVMILFGFIVGWTLIETATGMIHAFITRVDQQFEEFGKAPLSGKKRAIVSVGTLVSAFLLAQVGIIDLIAYGYTFMAYAMIAIFGLPLLTIGFYRIIKPQWKKSYWDKQKKSNVDAQG